MSYPGHQYGRNDAPCVPSAGGIARVRPFDAAAFETAVTAMLTAAGVDVESEHLRLSAQCVRELWQQRLLDGYDVDSADALGNGFADARRDVVIMRGITVHGMCPHHLLPFRGVAHIAYLPGGRLYGFGGLTRLVDAVCHRFVYQEWATDAIANALVAHGHARGAACVIEAEQLCQLIGEVRRGDERVVTQSFAGEFSKNSAARAEFLRVIGTSGTSGA
ncbi:GTP cyclohydrolase I FolE [Paraburkholderia rhizosphaerae]|uniref:GTP cyclohydrolase I n=1 Tax=Paraburkholderia rhizosphaerae TaxID=480658 RepID=A0A4R8LXA1_9BURK|nr:GTP cyclohydrolase I FolE [Paraburkholderia rhizosphaerae]TDY52302.1 GTP cyclohydrolase I [Paraburkholderia rhizosphaerae]